MDDSRLPLRGEDQNLSDSTYGHSPRCLCRNCRGDEHEKRVIDCEHGAPRSDVASKPSSCFRSDSFDGSAECEREKLGAEFCNTAPLTLQSPSLSPSDTPVFESVISGTTTSDTAVNHSLSTGGIDYLSLSCQGLFLFSHWEKLRIDFANAQQAAQENRTAETFLKISSGITVQVSPSGKGKGFSFARWKFHYRGIVFGVRDFHQASNSQSSKTTGSYFSSDIFIDVSSLPLMTFGEQGVYAEIQKVFDAIHFRVSKISPSRVDLCVDLVDVPMEEFSQAIHADRYVSRARKWTTIRDGDRVQTISLGRPGAKTMLRIYDKYEECKNNEVKYQLLVKNRWGKEPDFHRGATRVEFQIRRDHLRDQHNIVTHQDFLRKRNSLCQWLTYDWFRITEEEPDAKHTERFGPSRLWQTVIDAFQQWIGKKTDDRKKREMIGADHEQLLQQSAGCLISAFALLAIFPEDINDLQKKMLTLFDGKLERMLYEIPLRRLELEANFPYAQIASR